MNAEHMSCDELNRLQESIYGLMHACVDGPGRKMKQGANGLWNAIFEDVWRRSLAGRNPSFDYEYHGAMLERFSEPQAWKHPTAQRDARELVRAEVRGIVRRAFDLPTADEPAKLALVERMNDRTAPVNLMEHK